MIKVLVTGAGGQLGSSIRFVSERRMGFHFDYTDINELDICKRYETLNYIKNTSPDYIINCAGYTAVDRAESERDLCFRLNADAVKNLIEGCSQSHSKLIHISTDYVFDGNSRKPYQEDDITNPVSVYGQSKLQGELHLKNNPNAIIIRTAWLYSQFGSNFLKTILKYGREKEELKVVSDQTGSPTYAIDLAIAILSIIGLSGSDGKSFFPGTYHYSNEGVTTWFDFANIIIESARLNCRIIPIKTKDYQTVTPRPLYSVLNKSKIRNTFGLTIPHWKDSFRECISYL